MSDTDYTAGSSTDSTSTTTSSSNDTESYAQIVVPNYTLKNTVATSSASPAPTTTGSSFLRLGSFPSLSTSGEWPSGFQNSLTLAQLVGGTATSYDDAKADPSKYLSETGSDAAPDALMWDNDYQGDKSYLLGFVDDTRYRGPDKAQSPTSLYVDWTEVDNTVANRQAETSRLLFKGGWWDHADGNRISTTSGDKVEVVQGNYKLVVLGRQPPTAGDSSAAVADMSGGHQVDQDAAPNANVMCVEYVQSEGVWTVLEDNGQGNLTSKFHGQQREIFTGSKLETYVGSSPGSYDGNLTHLPDGANDPVIIEKTWAQRIEEYVGSDGKPVPSISSVVNAEAINEVVAATEITNTTMAALVMSTTTAPVVLETIIGNKIDVVGGLGLDMSGIKIEVAAGKYERLLVKEVVTDEVNELALLKQEVADLAFSLREVDTELTDATIRVNNRVTDVVQDVIKLQGTSVELGGSIMFIAEEIGIV